MALYRRVIMLMVGVLLLASVGKSLHSMVTDTPVMASAELLPVIIIDPGHGGIDGGAVGVDNIVEKDINLNISLVLRDMFVAGGFDVVMTRDTDISIHDEGVTGVKKQKTSDLRNRLALVESYPNAVFISVHQNKFGDASSKGAQIFASPNHPDSERFASILQESIAGVLQPDNTRQVKTAGKNLFLMYEAKCPAVLIECGFLSNSEEAHMLIDGEYQSKLAFTIFASTLKFLEMDVPGEIALQ